MIDDEIQTFNRNYENWLIKMTHGNEKNFQLKTQFLFKPSPDEKFSFKTIIIPRSQQKRVTFVYLHKMESKKSKNEGQYPNIILLGLNKYLSIVF